MFSIVLKLAMLVLILQKNGGIKKISYIDVIFFRKITVTLFMESRKKYMGE